MNSFTEGVRNTEFLVGYSGDTNLTRSGGYVDTTQTIVSGTPLMWNAATPKRLEPWDGTVGECVGLLLLTSPEEDETVPSRRVAYVSGGPQAVTDSDGRIPLPNGVTRAKLLVELTRLGITLID